MVIVKIIGGLGNQMFQYAYAKSLQLKGHTVKLDITEFESYLLHGGYQLNHYTIDIEIASTEEIRIFKNIFSKIGKKLKIDRKSIIEKSLLFNKKYLSVNNNYIEGYFQSEFYFIEHRKIIKEQFQIKSLLSKFTEKIIKEIEKLDSSCSIHIRRGDYISNNKAKNIHGSCSLDYYENAIKFLNEKGIDGQYFIFSDDIAWVKENLKVENAIYIDSEEKRIPHEDIYLMSLCTYNIIANSSFSWWGAWLNSNPNKIVIAPKRWFLDELKEKESMDIIPYSWVRI